MVIVWLWCYGVVQTWYNWAMYTIYYRYYIYNDIKVNGNIYNDIKVNGER